MSKIKDEEQEPETDLLTTIQEYFKDFVQLKDIAAIQHEVQEMMRLLETLYKGTNRTSYMMAEIETKMIEYFDTYKMKESSEIILGNRLKVDIQKHLTQEVEDCFAKYFPTLVAQSNTGHNNNNNSKPISTHNSYTATQGQTTMHVQNFHSHQTIIKGASNHQGVNLKVSLEHFLSNQWKNGAKDKNIQYLVPILVKHVRTQLQKRIDNYFCGSADDMFLACQFIKYKSDLYHQYGQSKNFNKEAELIVKKLKDSDPSQRQNLLIYLNRLDENLNFIKIDMMIEDVIRGNKPVATKKSKLVMGKQPVAHLRQDIFQNLGNIDNRNDGKIIQVPKTNYHSVLQSRGDNYVPSILEQSKSLEQMMQSVIDSKNGVNIDNHQIFLKRNYYFSPEDPRLPKN